MPVLRGTVRTNYPGDGGPGYNVFHVRTIGDAPDSYLEDVVNALNAFYSVIRQSSPEGVVISHDGVWRGVGPDVGTEIDLPGWTLNPVTSGSSLPEFVCANLRWQSARPGRSGRGRSFIGPLVPGALAANGNLSTTFRQSLTAAAISLIDDTSGGPGQNLVVWSPKLSTGADVLSASVPAELASLTTRRD